MNDKPYVTIYWGLHTFEFFKEGSGSGLVISRNIPKQVEAIFHLSKITDIKKLVNDHTEALRFFIDASNYETFISHYKMQVNKAQGNFILSPSGTVLSLKNR
jgi:hypothetical protein